MYSVPSSPTNSIRCNAPYDIACEPVTPSNSLILYDVDTCETEYLISTPRHRPQSRHGLTKRCVLARPRVHNTLGKSLRACDLERMQGRPRTGEPVHCDVTSSGNRVSVHHRDLLRTPRTRAVRERSRVDRVVRSEAEYFEVRLGVHGEGRAGLQIRGSGDGEDEVAILHAKVDGAELGDGVHLRSRGSVSYVVSGVNVCSRCKREERTSGVT